MDSKQAIVILNHGTRRKEAQEEFTGFTAGIRSSLPGYRIEQASMELSKPDLFDTVRKLYAENIRRIAVIPFFVFNGIHITRDISGMIEQLRAEYPDLELLQGRTLMPDDRLRDIVLNRIQEVLV